MERKYRHEEKFIAFIDILGFKNLLNKSGEEIIEHVVETIEESLDEYKKRFGRNPSAFFPQNFGVTRDR